MNLTFQHLKLNFSNLFLAHEFMPANLTKKKKNESKIVEELYFIRSSMLIYKDEEQEVWIGHFSASLAGVIFILGLKG